VSRSGKIHPIRHTTKDDYGQVRFAQALAKGRALRDTVPRSCAGKSLHVNHGQRVVVGQRLMQSAIGYMGSGQTFDEAIGEFAVDYADQNRSDHRAFVRAVRDGGSRSSSRLSEAGPAPCARGRSRSTSHDKRERRS